MKRLIPAIILASILTVPLQITTATKASAQKLDHEFFNNCLLLGYSFADCVYATTFRLEPDYNRRSPPPPSNYPGTNYPGVTTPHWNKR